MSGGAVTGAVGLRHLAGAPLLVLAGAAGALAEECPGDALGTPYAISDYAVSYLSDDNRFVFYEGSEPATGAAIDVLEDCVNREQLLNRVYFGTAREAADLDVASVFSDMVFGAEPVTMQEMARRLRAMGGEPEMRRVSYVSCACSMAGY